VTDHPQPSRRLDELAVRGIECWGHHGVFDFERREGQTFVVDLVLGVDTAPAAASDDLQDTVDYGPSGSRTCASWTPVFTGAG
jgi:dihydroneopterin aldolase